MNHRGFCMLVGGALLSTASFGTQAQELRIGFIAPKTGIFAQLGTDMSHHLYPAVRMPIWISAPGPSGRLRVSQWAYA